MAEKAKSVPLSPENVAKAREAINILSSLSLPGPSRVDSQSRPSGSSSSHSSAREDGDSERSMFLFNMI